MRYVLGVDGGGSKTACLAADENGRLLGFGLGGPVNTNYVARYEAVDSLRCAIDAALEAAGLPGMSIETLCMSAPMSPDAVAEATEGFPIRHITRAAEGETPRWAARYWIDAHIGVTVDAGTGSMARGWSRDGKEAGAGGWGATLGDEGSGYWISMRALQAILQAYDGRIEKTLLTEPVLEHLGTPEVVDIIFVASQGLVGAAEAVQVGVAPDSGSEAVAIGVGGVFFHRRARLEPLTRDQVAGLCPVVVDVARQGDRKAIEILREAGHELGRLGLAVIQRLEMEREAFAVVPFGGVFRAGELVLGSFRETLQAAVPGAVVVKPRFEPVVGAVLLALDRMGLAISRRVIEGVERSSVNYPACRVQM